MDLNELESIKDQNELDLLYKIVEIANDSKKRTEQILKGNKQAGVDVRKTMQDIKLISDIIRDKIQIRKFGVSDKTNTLEKAIAKEKDRIKKEEEKIKRLEENRSKTTY